ncbi:hypothetical protein M3Y96_01020300 [Aphelenchoides besseyi]|nr:hypothetical protein M3Y96_01020300 [Aphelenchoides besseyi]
MVNWTLPIGSDNLADFFATLSVGVDVPFQWIQQMQRRVLDLMFVFNGFKIVDEVCDNHRKQRLLITEQVLIDSNSANSPVKFIVTIPTQNSNSNSESMNTRKTQESSQPIH